MYREYFGLKELPFSIAPDPRYLYMSERHKEALAHLLYGVTGQGGFVVLTGEVGTGKTTICRCFLQQVPNNTDVAFIINPKLSARELLANICDEFGIQYPSSATIKIYNDLISSYLLNAHSEGRHTVVIIDEAQNLRIDVLEQLRLLTNLETSEKKLLQIILLGQPELQEMLAQTELRQLAQRVTARYHLQALNREEVTAYIRYRLAVAGQKRELFKVAAIKKVFKLSKGIPRLINLVCDRALLGAYAESSPQVLATHIAKAFKEIKGEERKTSKIILPKWFLAGTSIGVVFGALLILVLANFGSTQNNESNRVTSAASNEFVEQDSGESNLAYEEASCNEEDGERCNTESSSIFDRGSDDKALTEVVDPKLRYGSQFIASLEHTPPPFNSKLASYQSVLAAWGVHYTRDRNKLICEFAELEGLRCLHKQGNWRGLMKINRPAVLKLVNAKGQDFFIGLLAIDGDYAKITLGTKEVWVSLKTIDQQWYGDYSVVWRLPPYESRVIKPGTENDSEKWLSSNILKIKAKQGGYSGQEGTILRDDGLPIKEKVRWFQQSVGLKPDGIAGALTLIQLNSFINPGVPMLVRDATLSESPTS